MTSKLRTTTVGLVVALAFAVPAFAQTAPAAPGLDQQLATVRARQSALERKRDELEAKAAKRIADLEGRLAKLKAETPYPAEEIIPVQLALANAQHAKGEIAQGYAQRRAPLDAEEMRLRRARVAGGQDADPPAPAASSSRTREVLSATQVLQRDLLGEQVTPGTYTFGDTETVDAALDDPKVQEGIGAYQRERASRSYGALSPAEQDHFDLLLAEHAENPAAQAVLLKGLASGNELDDLDWLGQQLEGKDAAWIEQNTTLTGDGTNGLVQAYSHSCVPTTMQALHGEFDPVYALKLRQDGDVTAVDSVDPLKHAKDAALEQKAGLEAVYPADGDIVSKPGWSGKATARSALGGQGLYGFDHLANKSDDATGLEYQMVVAPDYTHGSSRVDSDVAKATLEGSLEQGVPVPLAVKWTSGGGHALLAYDRRVQTQPDGTETVDYRVYDPDDGQSTWIPQGDLIGANSKDGTFDYRGNTALNAYVMVAMEPGQGGRDANPALQRYQERNVVRDSVVTQEIR